MLFDASYQPTIGRAIMLRPGRDVTLVGTGLMVSRCLEAAQMLAREEVDARVLEVHTVCPPATPAPRPAGPWLPRWVREGMPDTVVLVHTVAPVLGVFAGLGQELLPGVQLLHILDEPLLERVRQRGGLAPEDTERLLAHTRLAERIGARTVLVTCSTISPCVDEIRSRAGLPVLKIDEAMIERAVELGTRVGVVATAPTTLEPTRQALEAEGERQGRPVRAELLLVEGAMAALMAGDGATHDRLVREAVLRLLPGVEVVVLAQASMARVLEAMPEAERAVPILASPQLALERVRQLLAQPRSRAQQGAA